MTSIQTVDTFVSAVRVAPQRGFAGLVLDGFDVRASVTAQTDVSLLAQAFEIAQQASEPAWAEFFARRIFEIDRKTSSRLRLASLLAAVGKCSEAQSLMVAADTSEELGRKVIGVLHAKAGRIDEAFQIFATLPGGNDHHPPSIVLSTAYEMVEQCDLAHAMALLQKLTDTYPAHILIRGLELRCQLYAGNVDRVRELAQLPDHALQRGSAFERRTFVDAAAESLALNGRASDLFDFVREEIGKDPAHWGLYIRAAVAAREAAREKEFAQLIDAIPPELLDNADALAVLCRRHVDENRDEEASLLLNRIHALSAPLFLDTSLYFALYTGDQARISAAFAACEKCGVPLLGPVIACGLHTYHYDCSVESLRICVTRLESLDCFASKNAHFWQLYLRCLIALDEDGRAEAIYANLPQGLAGGETLGPFEMFFDAAHGRHQAAKGGWTKYIRTTRHLCVNAPSSYPKTVQLNYADTPGAVLLFTTLLNAADYLDWFLAHYRALGVDHFFIVDNGSTDGSIERLAKERNVSFFSNQESFAKSGFGVLWINHLLQRFGVGHWCFHVDADEGFVFPGQDRGRSLRELLSYCDQRGFCAVPAIELDMYPELLDSQPAENRFESNCYFDVDYARVKSELPPYVMIQGGIRKRLTGLASAMQKTPLARIEADTRYVNCNHGTTHLPIADISGALLHYKFVGDFDARFEKAIIRGEHFAGAIGYRRLKRAVEPGDQSRSLLSPESRRYHGPSVLDECGLTRSNALWDAGMMDLRP